MNDGHNMIDGSPDVHPFDTPPNTEFFTEEYKRIIARKLLEEYEQEKNLEQ